MAQARIYRDAARRLLRTSRKLSHFDPVPYFLLCQSLELHLKAYVGVTDSLSLKTLKDDYGHKLPKLWKHAQDRGLGQYVWPTKDRNDVIALIGPIYSDRRLNYLDLGMMFRDNNVIRADKRVIPTLLRLTDAIDRKLSRQLSRLHLELATAPKKRRS